MNGLDTLPVYTGPELTIIIPKGKTKKTKKTKVVADTDPKKARKSKKLPRIFEIKYGTFIVEMN